MNFRNAAALTAVMLIPALGRAQDYSLQDLWPKQQTGTIMRNVKHGNKNTIELVMAMKKSEGNSYVHESASDLKKEAINAIIDGKKEDALRIAGNYDKLTLASKTPNNYWFVSPFVAKEAADSKLVTIESVGKQYGNPSWYLKVSDQISHSKSDFTSLIVPGSLEQDLVSVPNDPTDIASSGGGLFPKNGQMPDPAVVKRKNDLDKMSAQVNQALKSGASMVGFVKQQLGILVFKTQSKHGHQLKP